MPIQRTLIARGFIIDITVAAAAGLFMEPWFGVTLF